MCGIAGFIDPSGRTPAEAYSKIAEGMAQALNHRGPDDRGTWLDVERGVALAHARLSILDTSLHGHQPMVSSSERFVLVYNGEVYNFQDLKKEIESRRGSRGEGVQWRSHSDTEVVLEAFEEWGVEPALEKFVGMFSLALWDRREKILHLVRDRLGIKPLYYGWQGGVFVFGSELSPFKRLPNFEGAINRNALALFLRHNYVPSPYSIYQGVHKLLPGSRLELKFPIARDLPQPRRYWSAQDVAKSGAANPLSAGPEEAMERWDDLLRDAVRLRMISDVPLGAFLSGGIDSSTVVAVMQQISDRPVKTFSIGFVEEEYNEAQFAAQVAERLKTDHTELYVRPKDALDVIPRLPSLYDEPFADSSQIPTFLVSELARGQVTVSLSGDGGDELLGGYNRYNLGASIWSRASLIPQALRRAGARLLTSTSPETWNKCFRPIRSFLPKSFRFTNPGDKLHKLAGVLSARDASDFYQLLVSFWLNPSTVVLQSKEPPTPLTEVGLCADIPGFSQPAMLMDALTYLPDDILTKVDRASMGVGLEARVPLLDHRLFEFAWRLPWEMKQRNGQSKWPLRQTLYKHVPKELIERPKMGFGVPIDQWLKGPLKDWAEALLDESRLKREGFFDPAPIRKTWEDHLSGKRNWQYHLWGVLMFQAWNEQQKP